MSNYPLPPGNNQIPQGATRKFRADGFDAPTQLHTAPGNTDPWEIIFTDPVTQQSIQVASSDNPNGWGIGRNGIHFVIEVPKTARVSKGYELRMGIAVLF